MIRPMSNNRTQFRFRRGWLAASLLWLIFVLTLTHIPHDALPKVLQENMLDKIEHVAAYGITAFLFLQALPSLVHPALPVIGLLALAGIGILDEATQPLVNRYASVWDYAADLLGIILACMIFLVKKRLRFDTAAS